MCPSDTPNDNKFYCDSELVHKNVLNEKKTTILPKLIFRYKVFTLARGGFSDVARLVHYTNTTSHVNLKKC